MEEEKRIQLVEDAAERAQLLETVRQMPNGFNTIIGDRSEENLSDGTNFAYVRILGQFPTVAFDHTCQQ